jgi:hypothetical protein
MKIKHPDLETILHSVKRGGVEKEKAKEIETKKEKENEKEKNDRSNKVRLLIQNLDLYLCKTNAPPSSSSSCGLYRKLKTAVEILSNEHPFEQPSNHPGNQIHNNNDEKEIEKEKDEMNHLLSVLIHIHQNCALTTKANQMYARMEERLLEYAWTRLRWMVDSIWLNRRGGNWGIAVTNAIMYVDYVLSKSKDSDRFKVEFQHVVTLALSGTILRTDVVTEYNNAICWMIQFACEFYKHMDIGNGSVILSPLFEWTHRYYNLIFDVRDPNSIANNPNIPLESCIDRVATFLPLPNADVVIQVSRANLLETSIEAVMRYDADDWFECETMDVIYIEDSGSGVGLVFDWICSVADELFYKSPYFERLPEEPLVVHPVLLHLHTMLPSVYEFAGRLIGLALKIDVPIGVHFSNACIHMMNRGSVDLNTFQQIDPQAHLSLMKMTEMNDEEFTSVDLNQGFISYANSLELFPGGQKIPILYDLRTEYIKLMALNQQCKTFVHCRMMRKGMLDVLHSNNVNTIELELARLTPNAFNDIVGGRGLGADLPLDQWKSCTTLTYIGFSPLTLFFDEWSEGFKNMFFKMVEEMSGGERLKLLRFWTGLRCLPKSDFEGFNLRLVVQFHVPLNRLPISQTCMTSIQVPAYENFESLRRSFEIAIMDETMDNE